MSDCICNSTLPSRLLRGVTRTVKITVVDKNDDPVDLTIAREVTVRVSMDGRPWSEAYVPGISISGEGNNIVTFTWYADVQRCGRYTIDLNADFGNRNQSRVDFHREFGVELVEHSNEVSVTPSETLDVDDELDLSGTLEVTTDGMSAFDQWRTSPESEGYPPTEEGFFAWMRQPATDAATAAATQMRQIQDRADEDHRTAAADHTTAGNDHTTAASDHTTAAADHTQAGQDHTQAGNDHTTAAADHTRAEQDHATVGEAVKYTAQTLTDEQKAQARSNIGAGTYSKPSGGIPSTDLASAVQTSLGKADSAYQKPSGGIPASDMASGVIPTLNMLIVAVGYDSDEDEYIITNNVTFSDICDAYEAGKGLLLIYTDEDGYASEYTLSDYAADDDYITFSDSKSPEVVKSFTVNSDGTIDYAEQTARTSALTNDSLFVRGEAAGWNGTCATAAATAAKYVNCSSFTANDQVVGAVIVVTFSNTNTAAIGNLTLNIQNRGAKPIKRFVNGGLADLDAPGSLTGTMPFIYDGTNWVTWYDIDPTIATTQPNGGFLPNVVYDLGTLTGTVTFALASPTDNTRPNPYHWTFDTGSTAPTVSMPENLTWAGEGTPPTIEANYHYEIFVRKGYASYLSFNKSGQR